ncbi:GTPase IMAP family member 4 isoform X3 [Amphiprion ocellaris]|uniref:GTPase IMAP family member 4 isoform X3 n=1 Tax=Amphiprion ocellaris TaxID=80972 RepID=UPI002410DCEE|nr:GTPase IMAP family member 4 isoform X3 [Amphiprion ocellaris]
METNKPFETTATNASASEEEAKKAAAAAKLANRLPEIRLVVVGWRWPGKSLTGNTIIGKEEFRLERAAEFCVTRQTEVDGRQVTVVDTPGPHAFLLVIPVGMFTEVDRARIEEHVSLFGEHVWRHTIVVFTWAEILRSISIERYIRREGKDLQWVLEKCKRRYFVINNCIFGEHPQVGRLMEKVEKVVAEEGGYYNPAEVEKEKKPLDENQNPTRDVNELGARPKQNSGLGLSKAMEVEPLPN